MTYDPGDSDPRYVPPGSCTWCGHTPHDKVCSAKIRISKEGETGPCPCKRNQ